MRQWEPKAASLHTTIRFPAAHQPSRDGLLGPADLLSSFVLLCSQSSLAGVAVAWHSYPK